MSALLITITENNTTIEELPRLPSVPKQTRAIKAICPDCGSDNLRHRLYSRWHECKQCRKSFVADCSRHKHGGSLS